MKSAPGRLLLDLLGTAKATDSGQAKWDQLGAMARLHRLEPLLHFRHSENPAIPQSLRDQWRDAHRRAAMVALAQRADLEDCSALLAGQGFAPVALKGAFLAAHAYPEPALRPMRDLDLLVPQEQVLPAYRALMAAGYAPFEPPKIPLAEHARLEAHMPPLAMPRGSVLELHARISDLDGRLEYATPAGNEAGVIARAIELDGIRYPAPTDMLAHLVIHAVYGHRFDCGPLLLSDVHYLVARHPLDWTAFWTAARAGAWHDGARLVIELVRRYHGANAVPHHPAEPAPPPAAIVDLARDLLVQDWERKLYPRLLATAMTGGFGYLVRRLTGRVAAQGEEAVTIDRARDGGRLRWAGRQAALMAQGLASPATRRQAWQLARFRRWIER